MSSTETTEARRARYDRENRAVINRATLGIRQNNVTIPGDVERREFSAPCQFCEARGECRHRRSYLESEQPESQMALSLP